MHTLNFARHQKGYATLAVGVILLVIVSMAGLYLARSGIMDVRSSTNQVRYTEALAQAEGNLEAGMAWMAARSADDLDPDTWGLCADAAPSAFLTSRGWVEAFPAAQGWRCQMAAGANPPVHVAARQPAAGDPWFFVLVAEGTAANDNLAQAVVKQGFHFPFSGDSIMSPPPPFMGAGKVNLSGNFKVVTNPNGGCPPTSLNCGVPVSIWSANTINQDPGGGSWTTCQMAEYQGGTCDSDTLSVKGDLNQDIVAGDADFPDDMFAYVFGVSSSNYRAIKEMPQVIKRSNCSDLPALASATYTDADGNPYRPVVWVTGDCDVPGETIGSTANTLILVVQPKPAPSAQPGDITMRAGTVFHGLVIAFDENGNTGELSLNGGAVIRGAVLSNNSVEAGQTINGTFDLVYDPAVIANTQGTVSETKNSILVKVPGTWADYLR